LDQSFLGLGAYGIAKCQKELCGKLFDYRHQKNLPAGLDQLLLVPSSRRPAGIEIAEAEKNTLSPLGLMMAMKHREITREAYERQKNSKNSGGGLRDAGLARVRP
jgi:hypothetical protein